MLRSGFSCSWKLDDWRLLDSAAVITAQTEAERGKVLLLVCSFQFFQLCFYSFALLRKTALKRNLSRQHFLSRFPSVQYLDSASFWQDWRLKLDVQINKGVRFALHKLGWNLFDRDHNRERQSTQTLWAETYEFVKSKNGKNFLLCIFICAVWKV